MIEHWQSIAGFPGYEVSSQGRVKSFRKANHGIILCPIWTDRSYFVVNLYRDSQRFQRSIHRLVLETFRGPPALGQEARHLNGDPTDITLNNLAWGTPVENGADKRLHGSVRGEKHPRAKLTEQDVVILRRMRRLYPIAIWAWTFGVHRSTINKVLARETWHNGTTQTVEIRASS
jgi:hypothetical protein